MANKNLFTLEITNGQYKKKHVLHASLYVMANIMKLPGCDYAVNLNGNPSVQMRIKNGYLRQSNLCIGQHNLRRYCGVPRVISSLPRPALIQTRAGRPVPRLSQRPYAGFGAARECARPRHSSW